MSHFVVPKHIFVGNHALTQAMPALMKCGRNALIVTGKHVGKSPMCEMLMKELRENNINYNFFDGILGEPTDVMIQEGVNLFKESKCDFVIGIGGGSPLDSAKAIAAMAVNEGSISDYNGKMIQGKVAPIVAIPTTAGTGSEATMFTIVTDSKNGIKMLLKGECLVPTIAIVDPDYSMDMPKSVTVATGLDAFTHAVEAYTSKKAFEMTDVLAVSAIKRIMKYLPETLKNGYDANARKEMAYAALEAGVCINNSSVTLVHGMSRPIGALFHVPHGLSNAMLLKSCIGFALDGAYDRFAALGREIKVAKDQDSDEIAAKKFLDAIIDLVNICNVPSLKEYGIKEEEFFPALEKMATDAIASGSPSNTRKEVTKEDCISLYEIAYV